MLSAMVENARRSSVMPEKSTLSNASPSSSKASAAPLSFDGNFSNDEISFSFSSSFNLSRSPPSNAFTASLKSSKVNFASPRFFMVSSDKPRSLRSRSFIASLIFAMRSAIWRSDFWLRFVRSIPFPLPMFCDTYLLARSLTLSCAFFLLYAFSLFASSVNALSPPSTYFFQNSSPYLILRAFIASSFVLAVSNSSRMPSMLRSTLLFFDLRSVTILLMSKATPLPSMAKSFDVRLFISSTNFSAASKASVIALVASLPILARILSALSASPGMSRSWSASPLSCSS